MKAIKIKVSVYQNEKEREVVLPTTMHVIGSCHLTVEIAENHYKRPITLTKLIETYDHSKIELEYHFEDTGEVYMTVVGETVEVERIIMPDLNEAAKVAAAALEMELIAEANGGEVPKHLIN